MKHLLCLIVLGLTACASNKPYNQRTYLILDHTREYAPVGTDKFQVDTKEVAVTYTPDTVDPGLTFSMLNKTQKPITVVWDEANYVYPSGSTSRVFHSEVKLVDRAGPQAASVVPGGARLDDQLIPMENVQWTGAAWQYEPMCGKRKAPIGHWSFNHDLDDDSCLNQVHSFYLPYVIDGKKRTVEIKFKMVSKTPVSKK